MRCLTTRNWFISLALAGLLAIPLGLHAADAARKPVLGVAVANDADSAGVTLSQVTPDGPGGKAGLKKNDRIVQVEGREVKSFADLQSALANHKPGDSVAVKVMRDGKEETVNVTLGEAPEAFGRPVARSQSYLGVHAQALTADRKDHLKLTVDKGALVSEVLPNSPAAKAGLQENDVITRVGDTEVATPEELRAAIQKAHPDQEVTLKVIRGKQEMELKARLQGMSAAEEALGTSPERPEGFGPFSGKLPQFFMDIEKLPALEKKVQELERRIHELEQHQTK
jgi:S1-C subfamily serine protease